MNIFTQPAAAAPDKIIELREMLRQKFPRAHASPPVEHEARPVFPTGVEALDRIGLPKGSVVEVVAGGGAGLLVAGLLGGAEKEMFPFALIDGDDRFDPQDAGLSPALDLLWVRCSGDPAQAVRAADLLLRDGNLSLVVLDVADTPAAKLRRVPGSTWFRLRSLAEASGTVFFALTPVPIVRGTDLRFTCSPGTALPGLAALDPLRHELLAQLALEREGLPVPAPRLEAC